MSPRGSRGQALLTGFTQREYPPNPELSDHQRDPPQAVAKPELALVCHTQRPRQEPSRACCPERATFVKDRTGQTAVKPGS